MTSPKPKSYVKRYFMMCIKFILVFGIFYWLFQKKYLDLQLLQFSSSHDRWPYLFMTIFFIFFFMVLQVIRARFLFNAQNYHVPWKQFFKISWIGYFFSTFLPGGVTSDLIKYSYFQRYVNKSRTVTALLVLMDRVCGLFALFVLVFLISAYMLFGMHINALNIQQLFWGTTCILVLSMIAAFVLSHPKGQKLLFLPYFQRIVFVQRLMQAFQNFKDEKFAVTVAVVLSVVGHLVVLIGLYFLQYFVYESAMFSFFDIFLIFPFAILASVIPISPQGIGMAQLVIISVGAFFGMSDQAAAVTLYTVLQMLIMVCFFTGAVPYLNYNQQKTHDDPKPQTI